MPRSEDTPPTPGPAPSSRRERIDAWEAVVRQELLKARRRREPRFLREAGVEHVLPALRDARVGDPPQERL
jgi:hypothetical protein